MMKNFFKLSLDLLEKHLILRYLVVGFSVGLFDLVALYFLNTTLLIHYLVAATLAFTAAFLLSFMLHKFWTFRSRDLETYRKTHRQLIMYLGNSILSIVLNAFSMYVLVDTIGMVVIPAQIVAGLAVASVTFSISRNYIFKAVE